jgi:molecular chaperone DnaK
MYNASSAQGQGAQAGPQDGGQSQQQGPKGEGDVTDVDFEEVK